MDAWRRKIPVYLAMLSISKGYLVNLCISAGMMSFSCNRRHSRLLSASCRWCRDNQTRNWGQQYMRIHNKILPNLLHISLLSRVSNIMNNTLQCGFYPSLKWESNPLQVTTLWSISKVTRITNVLVNNHNTSLKSVNILSLHQRDILIKN